MSSTFRFVQKPRSLLPLLSLAALALPSAARANLIVNGDFEAFTTAFFANPGTPVTSLGWTFVNHAGIELTGGNPGKKVRLESNGLATSDPTIAQTVSGLNVGGTYLLEWDLDLRVPLQSGTGRSFGVFLDTQTFSNALFLDEFLGANYIHQSVSFVATSASHTFIFAGELDARTNGISGSDTDVSYSLDNVSLTGGEITTVPETSGAASLLCLSMLALAATAGRRARR